MLLLFDSAKLLARVSPKLRKQLPVEHDRTHFEKLPNEPIFRVDFKQNQQFAHRKRTQFSNPQLPQPNSRRPSPLEAIS
jgi:hypothetical protein